MKRLNQEMIDSPIGKIHLAFDGDTLCALDFEDYQPRMHELLQRHHGEHTLTPRPANSDAAKRLQAYFAGDIGAINGIEVTTGGTAFQRQCWQALRRIAAGTTASYAEQAKRIGKPKAMRAVGMANGRNPVAIVVPCHRVIGADGSLTGFGGGLWRKEWLLRHEGALPALV
jgi:methylated-DNA-[protein]-cysteine S-methyltransferase